MGSTELGVRMLWIISAGFLVGVALRSLYVVPPMFALFCFVLAVAIVFASLGARNLTSGVLVGVGIIACGLGIMRMHAAVLPGEPELTKRLGERIELQG